MAEWKYKNKMVLAKDSPDGRFYHSQGEMHRSLELQQLERAGVIRWLEFQPRFHIIVAGKRIGTYTPDWKYIEGDRTVVEDYKGVETQQWKLKWKLVQALYPENEYRLSGARCTRKAVR